VTEKGPQRDELAALPSTLPSAMGVSGQSTHTWVRVLSSQRPPTWPKGRGSRSKLTGGNSNKEVKITSD
jgi:hypothetical protein